MSVRFPELGFYTLPGRVSDPRPLLQEVADAERIGLGSVWISERQDVKEAAVLSGAAAARTSELAVAVGVTNPNTRHPMVTAAIGSTMQRAHAAGASRSASAAASTCARTCGACRA